jgi:hypothetical protein
VSAAAAGLVPDLSATQEIRVSVLIARAEYFRTMKAARDNLRATLAAACGRAISDEDLAAVLATGGVP